MSIKFKFTLAIILCLIFVMSLGVLYLRNLQTQVLEQEARNRVEMVLNFTHAARTYVKRHLRPVARQIAPEKMIFEAMSSTFVSSKIVDIFNEEMPQYVYKQATLSPLNLQNKADEFEADLVKYFRRHPDEQELTGYRQLNGEERFYLARAIEVEPGCLSCHGDPKIAPVELIHRYGNTHGFWWQPGEIISSLMIYVPTRDLETYADNLFQALFFTFVVLTVLLTLLTYGLFDKFVGRRIKKVAEVMDYTAKHPNFQASLPNKNQDEIDQVAQAFNQMSQQLKTSFSALADQNHKLQQLNQEKDEFLGIVAHDLKNPLSLIQGLADMIENEYHQMSDTEVIETANMIQIGSRQLFDLITHLLDVSAIESGKLNVQLMKMDILPIFLGVAERYKLRAKTKKLHLNIAYKETEQYEVYVDSHLLYQIFDNLISNAIKYSLPNKMIYVRLNQLDTDIHFEVEDEGPGLSQEEQQKLFNKFSRLTPRPTGNEHSTGLGLFIVKRLVEAMNGQVWCESTLGKGTKFVVKFQKVNDGLKNSLDSLQ